MAHLVNPDQDIRKNGKDTFSSKLNVLSLLDDATLESDIACLSELCSHHGFISRRLDVDQPLPDQLGSGDLLLLCVSPRLFTPEVVTTLKQLPHRFAVVVCERYYDTQVFKAHETGTRAGLWMLDPLVAASADAMCRRLELARWVAVETSANQREDVPEFDLQRLRIAYAPVLDIAGNELTGAVVQYSYYVEGVGHIPQALLHRYLVANGHSQEVSEQIMAQVERDVGLDGLSSMQFFVPQIGPGRTEQAFDTSRADNENSEHLARIHMLTAPGDLDLLAKSSRKRSRDAVSGHAAGYMFAVSQNDGMPTTICLSAASAAGPAGTARLIQDIDNAHALGLDVLVCDVDEPGLLRPLFDARADYLTGTILGDVRSADELVHLAAARPAERVFRGPARASSKMPLPTALAGRPSIHRQGGGGLRQREFRV